MRIFLVAIVWAIAVGGIACDDKTSKQGAEPSAKSGADPGPAQTSTRLEAQPVTAALAGQLLGRLTAQAGCAAEQPRAPLWCGIEQATFSKDANAAPLESTRMVMGLGIPVSEEGGDTLEEHAPMALAIQVGDGSLSAAWTRVMARNPANQPQIDGLTHQLRDALEQTDAETPEVVVHDVRLLEFLRSRATAAEAAAKLSGDHWIVRGRQQGVFARLEGAPARWVSVHRSVGRDEVTWVSLLREVELVGEVTPTQDLDLSAAHEQAKCGKDGAVREVCTILDAFAEGEPVDVPAGDALTYVGTVVGTAEPREAVGAAHLKRIEVQPRIAFGEVGATTVEEEKALNALRQAVTAGSVDAIEGNAAWAFISAQRDRAEAFGGLLPSDGPSRLVPRTGVFRAAPEARTITYVRQLPDSGELIMVTHDHLSGFVWGWRLKPVVAS